VKPLRFAPWQEIDGVFRAIVIEVFVERRLEHEEAIGDRHNENAWHIPELTVRENSRELCDAAERSRDSPTGYQETGPWAAPASANDLRALLALSGRLSFDRGF